MGTVAILSSRGTRTPLAGDGNLAWDNLS
jgi:hypothetical protein